MISPGGRVLDLAAGSGRHARLLCAMGFDVQAVDRDPSAIAALGAIAGIRVLALDLEGAPWPFAPHAFDAVVVTNYLYRPRLSNLLDALKPQGVLIYETFMVGNEALGKPSNPDFLLEPGELLDRVAGRMAVLAFDQGRVELPRPAFVQRICAIAH
jgi:SAM-dependent methyltransferase